jgi:RNA polymerase sigma-70 factor (ECF subfamily)
MDAAEDVVQDTLTAAVASGTQFRGRSKRLTWAFGILKHKIADYQRASYRDRARRADVSTIVDESAEVHRGRGQLFGGIDEDNPASQCEYAEFWNVLKAGVDRLPPQTAEVFQRCFIRNDSSLEICQALDISRSNYWVMLHRARIHLRSYLAENWAAPSTLN